MSTAIGPPPVLTTDAYTDPGAAIFDFRGTPYVWGYLNISGNAVLVSLLVGSSQGQVDWSIDYPVFSGFLPLSAGGARPGGQAGDAIYGVRVRALTPGSQATISGAFFQAGETGIVPGATGTGAVPCPCALDVTDGIITVDPTQTLFIGSGITLTNPSAGVAEITAAAGSSDIFWPAADQANASYDKTTYPDTFSGSGFLDTLVFSAELSAFALAIQGEAFPRLFIASTMIAGGGVSGGIRMNDGTADPVGDGVAYGMISTNQGSPVGSPYALIQSNSSPWLFGGVDPQSTQPTCTVVNGLQLQRVQGSVVGGSVIQYSGNGVPTIGGNAGDKYWRADGTVGTSTLLYTCTVMGAPTFATWVGIL